MPSKEILINQLFAGKYLEMGENVGHEIINMFEDDAGESYIYVTPSGVVGPEHDVEAVVFVRNVRSRRTAEVIAVAKDVRRIESGSFEEVKYGGVSLPQIFRGNSWKAEQDDYTNITFAADEVLLPATKSRLLLSLDETSFEGSQVIKLDSTQKVLFNQGMRGYYSAASNPVAYRQLSELIADGDKWSSDASARKLITDSSSADIRPSFLEVIGKENDELVFSNLLAYYFDYSHATFVSFAERVLGIANMDTRYSVARERDHIDIYIESANHAIVIENKLGSGINGIRNGKTQLDKYREATEEKSKAPNKHYFIFAPDYRIGELAEHARLSGYAIICYSDLYEFFVANTPVFIADSCFPDFLRGMRRHTVTTTAELNLETMRSRFLSRIRHSIS